MTPIPLLALLAGRSALPPDVPAFAESGFLEPGWQNGTATAALIEREPPRMRAVVLRANIRAE